MTLERELEPEIMDSDAEARDYDAMDHSEVNRQFVADLLAFGATQGIDSDLRILDLGTGTAQIPVEYCRQSEIGDILAIDASIAMLELARYNIEAAGCIERITLAKADAKQLGFDSEQFDLVMSNSIVHHIPEPETCLQELVRVLGAGGLVFVRDLVRPQDEATLKAQVANYVGHESQSAQDLFRESLRAALTLAEIREMVAELGFPPDSVNLSSDRHWTWAAVKP